MTSASRPAAELGIHAVTARQVGPLVASSSSTSRGAKVSISPGAKRPGRGPAEVHSDRVQRPRGPPAGCRHAALRTGAWPARHAGPGKRGAEQPAAGRRRSPRGRRQGEERQHAAEPGHGHRGGWLRELFPEDIASVPRVFYDAATKRVYAEEQLRFRDLAIATRRVEPPPADAGRAVAGRGGARRPADAQRMGPRRRAMDPAPEPAQPMVPGTRPAAHHRGGPPPPGRADLPRRLQLQGHQGPAGEAGREELA